MSTEIKEEIQISPIKKTFLFSEIENALVNGDISIKSFAEILCDNFGKKKARKILRRNIDLKLKEEGMSFDERQEYLFLISSLV